MSKYLPQKSFVVCTHQVNPTPGKLLADPNMWQFSVIYKSKNQPLLTEVDMLLMDDFECKNNWGKSLGWAAFAGGLVAGILVATGVGAIVVCLVAITVAAIVFTINSKATNCNPNLIEWKNPHSKVKFEGHKALTQTAFLTCSAGPGILAPFLDESEAKSAAKNVAYRNWGEVGITTVISGLFGFAVGYASGAALAGGGGIGAALYAGGKEVVVGFVGAYLIYQPISNLESAGMQSYFKSDNGDTSYDNMLSARQELENGFNIDSPDDFYVGSEQPVAINNSIYHGYDLYRQRQNQKYINEIFNVKGTQAEKKAQVAAIAEKMSRTRSGAQAVDAMKGRKSGEIYSRNPKLRKMNQGRNVIKQHRSETIKGLKSETNKGFGGLKAVGLILPLLVSPLNEWTFNVLATAHDNQSGGGVSINATQS